MSIDTTINFDGSGEVSFDSSLMEEVGGRLKLKDVTPADSTAYADYETDINLNWGDGTLTGTPVGGAAAVGGVLDLAHNDNRYVDYDADLNADSQQTGCVRAIIVPDYTGLPPSTQYIFTNCQASGISNNELTLYHQTNGVIYVRARDAAGTQFFYNDFGSWSAVSGVPTEIELNYDFTTGETRIFIGGHQAGTTKTDTGIRGASIGLLRVGGPYTGTIANNFSVADFLIFSTVQHTANYTPDWSGISPTRYSTANPAATTTSTWRILELLNFTENVPVKMGSDEVKYILTKDGTDYYWNGAAWAVSAGTYAQANTAAEILTNVASFTSVVTAITIKIFMHSDAGDTTPEIDSLSFSYAFGGDAKDTVQLCRVWFYSYDADDDIRSRIIAAKPTVNNVFYKTNIQVSEELIESQIDEATGFLYLDLYDNVNMTKAGDATTDVYYQIYRKNGSQWDKMYQIDVPEQDEADAKNIIVAGSSL